MTLTETGPGATPTKVLWAHPGEPLKEHLLAVARVGRELFPHETELFEKRTGVPWEYVAYFHDVGKAHVEYQGGWVDNYICHEVYSAAVAYKVLHEIYDERVAKIVASAVLLHHRYYEVERLSVCAYMFNRLKLSPRFEPAGDVNGLLAELLGREVDVGVISNAIGYAEVASSNTLVWSLEIYDRIMVGVEQLRQKVSEGKCGRYCQQMLAKKEQALRLVEEYMAKNRKDVDELIMLGADMLIVADSIVALQRGRRLPKMLYNVLTKHPVASKYLK